MSGPARGPAHPEPSQRDARPLVEGGRRRVNDDEMARMLEAAGGFRSRVAKQLGLSVSAISKRIARSARLREAARNIEETVLDIAESALVKAAQAGEPWAVCFILKCKGRGRGWIERHDLSVEAEAVDRPPLVLGLIPVPRTEAGDRPAPVDAIDVTGCVDAIEEDRK